jgi:spore maturation protein CgeB
MKILIVTGEYVAKDDAYMDNKGWAFQNAFQRLGHHTELFFYRKMGNLAALERKRYLKHAWLSYMNNKLLLLVKRTRPDILFLSRGETVTVETLQEIRKKTETVIINVFTDNPLFIGKFETIEPCHYFFVKDTYVRDTLRKAGLNNVRYLPQCTNADVYKPYVLDEKEKELFGAEVSLVGSHYAYRLKMVKELAAYNLSLWGRGWPRIHNQQNRHVVRGGDIRGPRKARVFSGSAISLNPHHPLNDIRGTNSRTFDIAACMGFQVSDDKEDLRDLLKVNEEIVCFKTIDELKKLIDYYLAQPDERRQLAEAAHRRVLRDHTYDNRAREIMDILRNA